jgi:hypothetical protein
MVENLFVFKMMLIRLLPNQCDELEKLDVEDIVVLDNVIHTTDCQIFHTMPDSRLLKERHLYLQFEVTRSFNCWKVLKTMTKLLKSQYPLFAGYVVSIYYMDSVVKIIRVIKDMGLKVILRFPCYDKLQQKITNEIKLLKGVSRLITGVCINGNVPYNKMEENVDKVNFLLRLPTAKIIVEFSCYATRLKREDLTYKLCVPTTCVPRSQCISKVFSTTQYNYEMEKKALHEDGFFWKDLNSDYKYYFDDYHGMRCKMALMKRLGVKDTMISNITEDCPIYHPSSIYWILKHDDESYYFTTENSAPLHVSIPLLEARKKPYHANDLEVTPSTCISECSKSCEPNVAPSQ